MISEYGTELTSNAVLVWCGEIGVEWHYIAPGKPMRCISFPRNWGELGIAGPYVRLSATGDDDRSPAWRQRRVAGASLAVLRAKYPAET
jgi:hypothetical protein